MNTTEAAEKWNTTRDVVARWCKDGKVPGAEKPKFRWVIPDDASRPIDKKLQREFGRSSKQRTIAYFALILPNGALIES